MLFAEVDGKLMKLAAAGDKAGNFWVLNAENGHLVDHTPVSSRSTRTPSRLSTATTTPARTPTAASSTTAAPSIRPPARSSCPAPTSGKWSAKNKAEYIAGQFYLGGAFPSLTGPNSGWFSAVDVASGVFNWRHHLGLPANGGALVMDNRDGKSLVFTGMLNGHFNAYDTKTGKLLWSHDTGASIVAPPATFTMNGARYVVVAAGDPGFLRSGAQAYRTRRADRVQHGRRARDQRLGSAVGTP